VEDVEIDKQLDRLRVADYGLAPDPLGSVSAGGGLDFSAPAAAPVLAVGVEESLITASTAAEIEEALAADVEAKEAACEPERVRELLALQDLARDDAPMGFVVSKTKGGACRRLHFVGGCFRRPGEHYRSYEDFGQQVPESSLYNARCKDCFPAGVFSQAAEEAEEAGSDSDGSESVSSAGDEDDANSGPPTPS
jgi:hypothetical protein